MHCIMLKQYRCSSYFFCRYEKNNLASDPIHAGLIAELLGKLHSAAATGPPLAVAFPPDVGPINHTATELVCEQEQDTGYLEPLDWRE